MIPIGNDFQLRVIVYDSVYPETIDEEILTIPVTRNPSEPTILNLGNLAATIWDTHVPGVLILDVNATDSDGVYTYIYIYIAFFLQ